MTYCNPELLSKSKSVKHVVNIQSLTQKFGSFSDVVLEIKETVNFSQEFSMVSAHSRLSFVVHFFQYFLEKPKTTLNYVLVQVCILLYRSRGRILSEANI